MEGRLRDGEMKVRWRDESEMERWTDGSEKWKRWGEDGDMKVRCMEIWRDGEMERWK